MRIKSPWHDQATAVRLNNRRKAKKPVMPMPSKAIEVGSGTGCMKLKLTGRGCADDRGRVDTPPSKTPDVVTVNVSCASHGWGVIRENHLSDPRMIFRTRQRRTGEAVGS